LNQSFLSVFRKGLNLKRQIIEIDEEKCSGCGLCVPDCKEGAIQIIEGKARLVSDLFCDGLGACIGTCPEGAIKIIEREAEPYSERKVMENLVKGPLEVIKAHLRHLKDHGEIEYFSQAVNFLKERGIENPLKSDNHNGNGHQGGCPGSRMISFAETVQPVKKNENTERAQSALSHWPVQLHLVSPAAGYFRDAELVVMSTCGPIASANVHSDYLEGRAVVVGCPKLDYTEPYAEKLASIFSQANTPKAIVVIMEVPCCRGLSAIVKQAAAMSGRTDLVVEEHTLSVRGELLQKNIIFGQNKKQTVASEVLTK